MSFPFTMQEFLIAAAVFSLVWWAGVFLWFRYKPGKGSPVVPGLKPALAGSGSSVKVGVEQVEEEGIMGKVKLPEGMELITSQQLRFAGQTDGGAEVDKEDQLGLIPDVLEEIKEIFGILAKEDGSKQEFLGLMKLVREKYPRLNSHPGIAGLNSYIRDHAPFLISSEELEDLWD